MCAPSVGAHLRGCPRCGWRCGWLGAPRRRRAETVRCLPAVRAGCARRRWPARAEGRCTGPGTLSAAAEPGRDCRGPRGTLPASCRSRSGTRPACRPRIRSPPRPGSAPRSGRRTPARTRCASPRPSRWGVRRAAPVHCAPSCDIAPEPWSSGWSPTCCPAPH